jgi:exosortase
LIVAGTVLVAMFGWAYWPTFVALTHQWSRQPDYSYGYFVAPLALCFVWARRDRFPGPAARLAWPGLVLVALSVGMRYAGARYYLEALDGWSMVLWVAGIVLLLGGWRVLWWALPAVLFLAFMVPLPFRVERELSLPLQTVVTTISCWALQSLGQPALAEGHAIVLGDHLLEVEQACVGLRIFVGVAALAVAYVVIARRAWWENAILLLSAIPIALAANAARVVATAWLHQSVSSEAARSFSHDAAGWMMVVLAAVLFAFVLWYLRELLPHAKPVEVGAMLRRQRDD